MKASIIFFVSALRSLAAAVPIDDVATTLYYGKCKALDGPGECVFTNNGESVTKPCGVNYKCKFTGENCHYNPTGGHAHCNL
ncbi:Uu.00g021680.m01.CDS01 [Anthostomella pinea]|uniref:Uu.00g021680.m01.CDS01 n=1 Tax=Anthostomella pinea TaxID=933095 RepID=A0AAI8VZP4_9PEZI|nr:Uu.00g021680.m01.CDS01 [Anthostomella pinea]